MGTAYEQTKFLMDWRNAIGEAIVKANRDNPNRFFHVQSQPCLFEKEDLTIYSEVKVFTFIKGSVVTFWIGIDVTSKTTQNGELMLYFDEDSNNSVHIQELNNPKTPLKFSTPRKVENGAQLILNKNQMQAGANMNTVKEFFTEAVNSLRQVELLIKAQP